ncbi:MAG TPA: hypothetical protein ENH82_00895 [bacterium]|nr:hypothetical protein [bacterium]
MNTKRYTWSKVAYENVAKKVLKFRQDLDQVSVEEIAEGLGVSVYLISRLGNERYWFIDIPPKSWETLQNAVNNLHIEGDVIKDYRKTPVKVILIEDLEKKKTRGRKKVEDDSPSPDDKDKVRTYVDPKHRDRKIHVAIPGDESEINPKDQEAFADRTDPVIADLVKKETIECTPEGKKSTESFLKPRIGNFEWVDKEKGLAKFVESPGGNFKVFDDDGFILSLPIGPPSGSDRYREKYYDDKPDLRAAMLASKGINFPGTPNAHSLPAKVELTAKALMTIDDQIRRIIKEEIPIIIEDCLSNIKFQIELPIKINT